MKDRDVADGYLEAPAAAVFVGMKPTQVRAFMAFVRKYRVRTCRRGERIVFRPSDLRDAIDRCTDEYEQRQQRDRFTRMEKLGQQHARGESKAS